MSADALIRSLALVRVLGLAMLVSVAWEAQGAPPPVTFAWWTLVAIPLLVHSAASTRRVGQHPEVREVLVGTSVAFGLVAADPWQTPAGTLLVWCFLLLVVLQFGLSMRLAHLLRTAPPRSAPPRPDQQRERPDAVRRSVLAATLMVMVLAFTLHFGLRQLAHLVERRPPPVENPLEEAEESLTGVSLEIPMDLRALVNRTPIALVVPESGMPISRRFPGMLYLRQFVFDRAQVSDGCLVLARSTGPLETLKDGDDGASDGRVTFPDGPSDPSLVVRIRHLTDGFLKLMMQPKVAWLEAETVFRYGGVLSVHKPELDDDYRFAADPSDYLSVRRTPIKRGEMASAVQVPDSFPDRDFLVSRVNNKLAGQPTDFARARTLERHLQQTGTYDLGAPWPGSYRAFLDGDRAGLCSHFAQLFAVMARLAGLPARIAVGYVAREWSDDQGCFIVRSSHYHAWAEVYFEEAGWVAFDPTPERAPDEGGEDEVGARIDEKPQEPVIEESLEEHTPVTLAVLLGVIFLFILSTYLLWPLFDRRRSTPRGLSSAARSATLAWRHWQRFLDLCAKAKLAKPATFTATEFLAVVRDRLPEEASGLGLLLREYHRCRFGGEELADAEERALREFLARFAQRTRSGLA